MLRTVCPDFGLEVRTRGMATQLLVVGHVPGDRRTCSMPGVEICRHIGGFEETEEER
ncbi:hypothetical protein NONO_c69120 [Nocardia nova SH22a]|uniref:Uncharacterized protein n=1 Tax=Nocardia nova SH22a TaxID=1415166 RepID=W5TQZ5_9NOCA|nr:hypothetical protein NONO_c69120 [Nocardia nova SH22a]